MNNRRQITKLLGLGLASPYLILGNSPASANVSVLQPIVEYQGHRNFVKSIAFFDGGSSFCSFTDSEFAKWTEHKEVANFRLRSNDLLSSMALDIATNRAILKSSIRYPIVVDLSNGQSSQPKFDIGGAYSVNAEQRILFNIIQLSGRQAGIYLASHDLDSKGSDGTFNFAAINVVKIDTPQAIWLTQGGLVSNDGTAAYWLDGGQQINGWMINEQRPTPQIFGHRSFINSIKLSPDGTQLLTSASGEMSLWDTQTGNQIKSYDFSSTGFRELGSGHRQTVYGVNSDFSIAIVNGFVIDIRSGEVIAQLPKPYTSHCAVSDGGEIIASGVNGRMAGFKL